MSTSKFDLAAVLAEAVSESDTMQERIEYIDIDKIDSDPNNFYAITDIDALAANIEMLGLQQPIRVRPGENDRVIIVSGHRRKAALQMLADEGKTQFRRVPCIRERTTSSPAMQELRLIYANSDTRHLSPAEVSKQAARVESLLYELKEEGVEFPGRMRDHVAQACKVSASKLARLKVIREGLIPNLLSFFDSGALSEQSAYALARFPADLQSRIAKACPIKDLIGINLERLLRLHEAGAQWTPSFSCSDGTPCRHGDAALRHDLSNYDACKGEQCCMTCSQATRSWSPCERMCAKAKKARSDAKAIADGNRAEAEQQRQSIAEQKTQANAQRLLPLIDAAGIADDEVIRWTYVGIPVKVIRRYAAGDFSSHLSAPELEPTRISDPILIARQLHCSTDFLFGLSDSPHTTNSSPSIPCIWHPGTDLPPVGAEIIAVDDYAFVDSYTYFGDEWLDTTTRWSDIVYWTFVPGNEQKELEDD